MRGEANFILAIAMLIRADRVLVVAMAHAL